MDITWLNSVYPWPNLQLCDRLCRWSSSTHKTTLQDICFQTCSSNRLGYSHFYTHISFDQNDDSHFITRIIKNASIHVVVLLHYISTTVFNWHFSYFLFWLHLTILEANLRRVSYIEVILNFANDEICFFLIESTNEYIYTYIYINIYIYIYIYI